MKKLSPRFVQTLIATGPLLLTINSGMTSGYSATLLPQIQAHDNPFPVNQDQASWIASTAVLPMAVGCLASGLLMNKLGRKTAHLITAVPFIAGWILIANAHHIAMLIIGRILTGLSSGILGTVTGVYISETSDAHHRAVLLCGMSLANTVGLLFVHVLGTFFHWQLTAYLSCTLPVVGALMLVAYAPESPAWLLMHNSREKALEAFVYCRGRDAQHEFDSLPTSTGTNNETTGNYTEKIVAKLRRLRRKEFARPLCVVGVYISVVQWSGVNAVTFYTVSIMQRALRDYDEYVAMLSVDVVRLLASLAACALAQRMGRRPLSLLSGIGTCVSLIVLVVAEVYCTGPIFGAYVPMVALISYVTFISIGFVPIPWTMIGEVFQLEDRDLGASITAFLAFLAFFVVVKIGPEMLEQLGVGGTFGVYGCIAGCGTVFLWFFLPETRNMPLHELENK